MSKIDYPLHKLHEKSINRNLISNQERNRQNFGLNRYDLHVWFSDKLYKIRSDYDCFCIYQNKQIANLSNFCKKKTFFLSNSIKTKWFVHLLAIPLSSYIISNALCYFENEEEGVYQSYSSRCCALFYNNNHLFMAEEKNKTDPCKLSIC